MAGWAPALRLVALGALLGCTSTGVVGAGADCPKPCAASQVCHPALLTCVDCTSDAECSSKKPHCDGTLHACLQCRTPSDCSSDQPLCLQGKCQQCAAATDCAANQTCSSGKCKSVDDHSGDTGESGAGGN
jgi:hypothetical protein